MMEFRRLHATCDRYEPVAYERRIEPREDGQFNVILRSGDQEMVLVQPTLARARTLHDMMPLDVYEGDIAPWSVNCHLDKRKPVYEKLI